MDPGDITIHYPVEDDLPPVNVEIRPDTEQSIDKQGTLIGHQILAVLNGRSTLINL